MTFCHTSSPKITGNHKILPDFCLRFKFSNLVPRFSYLHAELQGFGLWFRDLDDDSKEDIYAAMLVLAAIGPSLGRPRIDSVYGSKHSNMKELRVQSKGRPIRIFFTLIQKGMQFSCVAAIKLVRNGSMM